MGICIAVRFDFAKCLFIEFIQNIRMCRVRMFKTLREVFSSYLRNIIYIKSTTPCINYQQMFITLCFPQKKELCFLSGQKMAASPCLTLFTCTSCFQLPASTCRTPSSCTEIGSCFKNQQESDLGLRQRLLQLGTRILHQFSFLIFSPLKFLVPHPWRGF